MKRTQQGHKIITKQPPTKDAASSKKNPKSKSHPLFEEKFWPLALKKWRKTLKLREEGMTPAGNQTDLDNRTRLYRPQQ
jgi:hypothetical protein